MSVSIGETVVGGSSASVLYVSSTGNLAQDSSIFNYDASTKKMSVGNVCLSKTDGVYGISSTYGSTSVMSWPGNENFFVGTLVGNNSLISGATGSTSGVRNAGFGVAVLQSLTTGHRNCCFGFSVGSAITSGSYNTGFGEAVFDTATSPIYNCAFGHHASRLLTTGSNNATFGDYSLEYNQTGTHNAAFGYSALRYATGIENTAVGSMAGAATTTGYKNTLLGKSAGTYLTSGYLNTGLGWGALRTTTGTYNTAVGAVALGSAVSGNENTAVGYFAGFNVTGRRNTIIGASNCSGGVLAGNNNIIIGFAPNLFPVDGNTDNQLNIGNLIFGTGLSITTTLSTGNVGFGVTKPTAGLHLRSGTSASAPLRFGIGSNLITPESGAVEFDGSRLTVTNSSLERKTLAYVGEDTSISINDTVMTKQSIYLVSSNPVLPFANNASGIRYVVYRDITGIGFTVSSGIGDTINGSFALNANETASFVSDGTSIWYRL